MQSSAPRLAALNFGIQLVWGAILAVSLQARCIELAHGDAVRAYALIATLGASVAACVQIAVGHFADLRARVTGHRREFYAVGIVVSLPVLLWFFSATAFVPLLISFFVLQISMNVASGPYQAAIPDHVPTALQGRTASWMSALQSLGAAAGLVAAGFIHDEHVVGLILASGLAISFVISYLHLRMLAVQPVTPQPMTYSRSLLILLTSRGFINIGFYVLLGFLVFYVRDSMGVFDAAKQRMDAALLFLTFTLTGIFGAIAAAKPTDTFDKRIVIGVANALMIVALLVLAATKSFAIAYVAAALAGIAWGAFVTADWAIACSILPRQSIATAMGVWNLASVVPQIIAPIVAAPLVLYGNTLSVGIGPRLAMAAAAVAYFLGTWFIRYLPRLETTEL